MGVHEGLKIGRYQLGRMLGEGGFGKVFVARDEQLGRDVALKVLLPEHCGNAEILKRFFHEARAAAAIRHAGIVMVFEYGRIEDTGTEADGSAFIAMEMLSGESLASRLRRAPALSIGEALAITRQIAAALGAAHAEGIVHRDLKPDNVYLVPDDSAIGGCRVKVLDFGIAKLQGGSAAGSGNTRTLMVFGTPPYMSPEQCRSSAKIDHRSDIYALGCIVFEMLCGKTPFAGDAGELIALHQLQPPPRPSTLARIDASLEKVVLGMLAKKPDERPQSMEELRGILDQLTVRDAGARPARTPEPAKAPPRRTASEPPHVATTLMEATGSRPTTIETGAARPKRLLFASAALGAMVLGGVGLWLAMKPAGNKPSGGDELANTLTRPSGSPSASPPAANTPSASAAASRPVPGKPSFSDDFDRALLGPGYLQTGPGFSLTKGALRARLAGGALWIEEPLPASAQIEVDVWTKGKSVFALELWGDGGPSMRQSGYRLGMASDSGQASLGRPDDSTQVTRSDTKLVPGRTYHVTVRRSGGRIDWLLDDDTTPFLHLDDPAPPAEPTPRFLGFIATGGDVFFDNLVIRPLPADPAAAAASPGPPWPTLPAAQPSWAHVYPRLPAVILGVPTEHPGTGFRPARGVTSPSGSYWIQTREVTAKQLAAVVQGTAQAVQDAPAGPALGVGFNTAVDYCRRFGGELPTEAEWEYAARGPELRPYPWGSEPQAPATGDATPGPTPIHDLLGGAREWTSDIWRNDLPCPADKPDCERYFSDGKEIGVLRGLAAKQLTSPLPPLAIATRSRLCRSGPCVAAAAKLLGDVGFRCVRRDAAE